MYNNFYNNPYGYSYPQAQFTQSTPYQQQMLQGNQMSLPQQSTSNSFTGAIIKSYDDVKNYYVPLGGSVLLLDPDSSRFYIKKLDDTGVPVVSAYNYSIDIKNDTLENKNEVMQDSEREELKKSYNSLDERVKILESKLNSSYTNNKK